MLLLFLSAGEKHHMLPTGELLIFSVTPADAHSTYRCRTVHHVTGDTVESSSYARLVVTGKSSQDVRKSVSPDLFEWKSGNPLSIGQASSEIAAKLRKGKLSVLTISTVKGRLNNNEALIML